MYKNEFLEYEFMIDEAKKTQSRQFVRKLQRELYKLKSSKVNEISRETLRFGNRKRRRKGD